MSDTEPELKVTPEKARCNVPACHAAFQALTVERDALQLQLEGTVAKANEIVAERDGLLSLLREIRDYTNAGQDSCYGKLIDKAVGR